MKTYQAKKGEVERTWRLIDATGVPLGRLSSRIAVMLRGKDKPTFTPHVDTGSFVVVINASKVKLTGKKMVQKYYYSHSQVPGGLTAVSAKELLRKAPGRLVYLAVKRMLPPNRLRGKLMRKLKVYAGESHPHGAQRPVMVEI